MPVRKILLGFDIDKAISRGAMQNPVSIDYFIAFAARQADYRIEVCWARCAMCETSLVIVTGAVNIHRGHGCAARAADGTLR